MKLQKSRIGKLVLLTILGLFVFSAAAPKNIFTRRYMWVGFDWLDRWNDQLYGLVDRASNAGYNGIMVRAWFGDIDKNSQKIKMLPKLKAFKAYAEGKGITTIPVSLCVIEGSEEDPNLSDVLPVKGTPFLATGTTASVKSDHSAAIVNGGFEAGTANKPTGWHIGSYAPGTHLFLDTQVKHSGKASLRLENPSSSFITQKVTGLKPFRAYQLSMWVKTQTYTGSQFLGFMVQEPNTNVLYYKRDSGFNMWGIPQNQLTFGKFACDFNTLDNTTITLRVMIPAGTGKFWLDDIQIKEVGLYEAIRRPSCPVTVKSHDGTTIYTEGKDYSVRNCPHRIGGTYPLGNELTIPAGSRIKSGDKLLVDWYQHGDVDSYHAPMSYCAKGAFDLQEHTIDILDNAFDTSKAFYAFIDEWRVAGYDPACSGFKGAGENMSWVANVTDCQLRQNYPNRDVYMCNDMFDPYHNGGYKSYFATRGGTVGAHKNLPSSMIILNWLNSNGGGMNKQNYTYKSLRFFGGLDPKYPGVFNRQIISPEFLAPQEGEKWEWCLSEAEKEGLTGVIGMAYVTWINNYDKLEHAAQIYKDAGRWGTGPIPFGDVPHKGAAGQCDYSTPKPGNVPSVASAPAPVNKPGLTLTVQPGKIEYILKKSAKTSLALYDVQGKHIRLFEKGRQLAGKYSFDMRGLALPAGMYIAKLNTNDNGVQQSLSHRFVMF